MLEYEQLFGFAKNETTITVDITDVEVDGNTERSIVVNQPTERHPFLMYYSLQMFFANGGGPCYITSVGRYGADLASGESQITAITSEGDFVAGLNAIAKVDEPTLIVFPDATGLSGPTAFYDLYEAALSQCKKLQDRFTIIDTHAYDELSPLDATSSIAVMRTELSGEKDDLKFGAVYYPFLKTILNYAFDPADVKIKHISEGEPIAQEVITDNVGDINTNLPTLLSNLVDKGAADLAGSLADVFNYLYQDNNPDQGFNLEILMITIRFSMHLDQLLYKRA